MFRRNSECGEAKKEDIMRKKLVGARSKAGRRSRVGLGQLSEKERKETLYYQNQV